jgi:predicted hydrolase (HD superfamily)
MRQADWAREIARTLLETPLPRRWAHVQGVARQARSLAPILGDDADLLESAAWLHDIGYSPDLVVTGFHPLDGARYLRDEQYADAVLSGLVAYHSCAVHEAEDRGLAGELAAEFTPASWLLSDALTYCDMTTTPDGQRVKVENRLSEIQARYGAGHLVTRFIQRSSGHLIGAVRAIERVQMGTT